MNRSQPDAHFLPPLFIGMRVSSSTQRACRSEPRKACQEASALGGVLDKTPVAWGTLLSLGITREFRKLGLAWEKWGQASLSGGRRWRRGPGCPPSLSRTVQGGEPGQARTHTPLLWATLQLVPRPAGPPVLAPPFPNEHRLAHPMRGRPGFLTEPHVCCLGATPQSQLRLSREEPLPGTENLANAAAVKKGTDDGEGMSPCQAHPTHCCLSSTHLVGSTGEEI